MSHSASRHLLPRILISIIGLSLSGIGVGIFLFSQMGLDPASTFEKALGAKLGVSFGTAAAIINVVILLIVFFIDRKYISISSLLASSSSAMSPTARAGCSAVCLPVSCRCRSG